MPSDLNDLTPRQRAIRAWGIRHPARISAIAGLMLGLYSWRVIGAALPGVLIGLVFFVVVYLLKRRNPGGSE